MESRQPMKESLFEKLFRGFGNQLSTLINLNINGSPIEDLDTNLYQSMYDCPSIDTPFNKSLIENATNSEEYKYSNRDNQRMKQDNLINDKQHEFQRRNKVIEITDYIKEKNKDPEIVSSHCSSLNSAFRLLNTDNRYQKSNIDENQRRNAISGNNQIAKPLPVLTLQKRKRDIEEEQELHHTTIIKKQKLNEYNTEAILQYKNNVNDDISMRSYKSYLSNRKDKEANQSMNVKKIGSLNLSLKSLDEIKKDIESKRKETERKVDEFQRKNISIRNTKEAYEDKKQILIDYYNEKAKTLKEVTMTIEKERLRKDSNFNNLKLAKNDTMSFKGKEKAKPVETIMKQNELFFDKSIKKNEINENKDNNEQQSMDWVKKAGSSIFSIISPETEKTKEQQQPIDLKRNISFASNSNVSFQNNDSSKRNTLFDNMNKTTIDDNKDKIKKKSKGINIFANISTIDQEEKSKEIPSIFTNIDKSKTESQLEANKPTSATPSAVPQATQLFSSMISPTVTISETSTIPPKENKLPKESISPIESIPQNKSTFSGVLGLGTSINKTEDNKPVTSSLFNKNEAQAPSMSLFSTEDHNMTTSIFNSNSNTNSNNETKAPTINLFGNLANTQISPSILSTFTSPQESKSIFKNNNTLESNAQTPTFLIPGQSLFSPKENQINLNDKDDKVKDFISKNESSAGSLMTPNNPFIKHDQKASIPTVFKSPTKPLDNNNNCGGTGFNNLYSSSGKSNSFIPNSNNNNQSTSLFHSNNLFTNNQNNQNISTLFTENSFSNPVTNNSKLFS